MPANDCVGLHNYECRSPILPDMRKQNPKPSVARRQAGPFVYALEDRQLLPEPNSPKRWLDARRRALVGSEKDTGQMQPCRMIVPAMTLEVNALCCNLF